VSPETRVNSRTVERDAGNSDQNVVFSTTILTVPGYLARRVKVSSVSMASVASSSSSTSSSETSSPSNSSNDHGGEDADDRKMPAAAACVSVGEDRAAERLFGEREERATRTAEGLLIGIRLPASDGCVIEAGSGTELEN
jgi:hypothetical protein